MHDVQSTIERVLEQLKMLKGFLEGKLRTKRGGERPYIRRLLAEKGLDGALTHRD